MPRGYGGTGILWKKELDHLFNIIDIDSAATENNKLNIYTQYLMKSTFETICLFFHRSVGLVKLLIGLGVSVFCNLIAGSVLLYYD
jgi:hypothetical protein